MEKFVIKDGKPLKCNILISRAINADVPVLPVAEEHDGSGVKCISGCDTENTDSEENTAE